MPSKQFPPKVNVHDFNITPVTIPAGSSYETLTVALGDGSNDVSITVKGMNQTYDVLAMTSPINTNSLSLWTGTPIVQNAVALTSGYYRAHSLLGSCGLPNKYIKVRVTNKGASDATLENIIISYT